MSLDKLSARMSELDRQILDLVAERQSVVEEIGAVKQEGGQATRDFAREKQVIDTAREQAVSLGIPPELAETLMELLIRSSLTNQERARVRAEAHGKGRQALVIGGGGKMGQWFAEFFDSQGFEVTVADPENPIDGFKQIDDWRKTPDSFDVTVIAAPIGVTVDILDDIASVGRKGLIFDIGSLKSPLEDGLRRLAGTGTKITSLHPMFGPDTELLSGRHVLFLDVGSPEATREARQLFAPTMAQQIEMKLEDHDRLIAYVLGLSHALNIAFFTALAESGEQIAKSLRICRAPRSTRSSKLRHAWPTRVRNSILKSSASIHMGRHRFANLRKPFSRSAISSKPAMSTHSSRSWSAGGVTWISGASFALKQKPGWRDRAFVVMLQGGSNRKSYSWQNWWSTRSANIWDLAK